MSEELPEPAAVDPATLEEPAAPAPATDAPGDKIYICPACGTRYDDSTTCSNGHAPAATVEYDRAVIEAAAAGDADALATVNETAAAAAGNMAGASMTEATPAPPAVADPGAAPAVTPAAAGAPGAPAAGTPDAPAAPVIPPTPAAPAAPELGGVAHALSQLEAAISAAKNSLGIV